MSPAQNSGCTYRYPCSMKWPIDFTPRSRHQRLIVPYMVRPQASAKASRYWNFAAVSSSPANFSVWAT